jgi:hypothetical protein
MSNQDESNGVPEDEGNSETEGPIESGRSATEEEPQDPTRAAPTGPSNDQGSAENDSGAAA